MPLLQGLLDSLKQFGNPLPFSAVGCLDVGLSEGNRASLATQGVQVVEARWDLPVEPALQKLTPHLRSLTARPFLPDYFPGYDIYLWIDCDAWVQERFVFEWFFRAAKDGALAVAPEIDRSYNQRIGHSWKADRLRRYYGENAAEKMLTQHYFNAGVFAMRADAPHWSHWAAHFEAGLKATGGTLVCDQTALNHAIWSHQLPMHPLPSTCNWLCHLALPAFDFARQKFCEPLFPHSPLGVLHLTANTKDLRVTLNDESSGTFRAAGLRFQAA
ncbi:hypothetical protein [Paraburkholderia sp. DHOC27]|uniref:hypothetical protein n=1 Tax=Paraburkholderia sp. DHOC27 TaxID=2303330 RepID=UPI0011C1AE55|nr:hypothetical protein [Paraburkholderia sp. DHOC27]